MKKCFRKLFHSIDHYITDIFLNWLCYLKYKKYRCNVKITYKPSSSEDFLGEIDPRTAAYFNMCEDSHYISTKKSEKSVYESLLKEHCSFYIIFICFLFSGLLYFPVDAAAKKRTNKEITSYVKNVEDSDVYSKNASKNTKKIKKQVNKPSKKSNVFIGENGSDVKEIEVNSVNFIKLKDKANEIFIPDPKIADVQMLNDSSMYLMGLEPGITSLVINDKAGNVILDYKIKVTYPLKTIKKALSEMHPDSEVEIVSVENTVVLKGRVPSPEIASDVEDIVTRFVEKGNIINKLSVETSTQVMLKVKIAEVTRNLTKSLGINWRAFSESKSANGMHYGFLSGDSTLFPAKIKELDKQVEEILKQDAILGAKIKGSRWIIHNGGHNNLSGLIDALASESFAYVLAEPTLVSLSGKTATFRSGGEQGFTVSQPGSNTNTTEFKEWGTSVEFTPTVISEDRITITVTPKVSTAQLDEKERPYLTSKDATTTVELGSGESLAIAGLLQKTSDTNTSETPFFSDIPVVGSLFRQSSITKVEKELVIIVTPYIVKPSSKPLKTPVDMVPRMFSPLESILTRRFHDKVKTTNLSAGFSVK